MTQRIIEKKNKGRNEMTLRLRLLSTCGGDHHEVPIPSPFLCHQQQATAAALGVLPTGHPFFYFDPFVRSENMNVNHHHLRFALATADADFKAALANGSGGDQSDSDSLSVVDFSHHPTNPPSHKRLLDIDLNFPPSSQSCLILDSGNVVGSDREFYFHFKFLFL